MQVKIHNLEQNTLLWKTEAVPPNSTLVSTKMPCDECSPVIYDCGIRRVVTNYQAPKSANDPARFRGLCYEKVAKLIPNLWVFHKE
jgi:deoxycytidylate deaminase